MPSNPWANKKYESVVKHIPTSKHYFHLLGVHTRSGLTEIKEARRRLALVVHPDVNSAPNAHDLMALVNLAAHRLIYDQRTYLIELYSNGLRKCPECKGRGVFEQQKGFNHTIVSSCKECHGSGLR